MVDFNLRGVIPTETACYIISVYTYEKSEQGAYQSQSLAVCQQVELPVQFIPIMFLFISEPFISSLKFIFHRFQGLCFRLRENLRLETLADYRRNAPHPEAGTK